MIITLTLLGACLIGSTFALRWFSGRPMDRMWPGSAVPTLAVGAALNGAAVLLLAGLLILVVLTQLPVVAAWGPWSTQYLAITVPVPLAVAIPAAAAGPVLAGRAMWRTGRLLVLLVRSNQLSRRLRTAGHPIVFVDDTPADAFAVAGARGCVVISRALYDELEPPERRVLIAHELSHLRRRHHLYVHAVDLAAAANPLLAPARAAVRVGVERWADEDAAAACGRRRLAGRALARTALVQARLRKEFAGPALGRSSSILCATAGGVPDRAGALLADPKPRRRMLLLGVAALLAVTGTLGVIWAGQVHDGFERAELDCPGLAPPVAAP